MILFYALQAFSFKFCYLQNVKQSSDAYNLFSTTKSYNL